MVIWTSQARADLKAVHDRIAKDSRKRARRIVQEIRAKANSLPKPPPLPGIKVPEVNNPYLREVPIYSWRIIFILQQSGDIVILTIMHKRRSPTVEQILPPDMLDVIPPST